MNVRKKQVTRVVELNEPHYQEDKKNEGDQAN